MAASPTATSPTATSSTESRDEYLPPSLETRVTDDAFNGTDAPNAPGAVNGDGRSVADRAPQGLVLDGAGEVDVARLFMSR